MENQHRLIEGYRELNDLEINAMNAFKEREQDLLGLLSDERFDKAFSITPDPRWLAIGKTHLQQGFMAIGRAIARPDGY